MGDWVTRVIQYPLVLSRFDDRAYHLAATYVKTLQIFTPVWI